MVPAKVTRSSGMPSKSSSSEPAGSQASPRPSRSLSSCRNVPGMIDGLAMSGQSSTLSGTPSASASSSTGEQAVDDGGGRTAVWHVPPAGQSVLAAHGVMSEEHTAELQSLAYLVCPLLTVKTKIRLCSLPVRVPEYQGWR